MCFVAFSVSFGKNLVTTWISGTCVSSPLSFYSDSFPNIIIPLYPRYSVTSLLQPVLQLLCSFMHLYCLPTAAKNEKKHFMAFYLCEVTNSILVWQLFLLLQLLWNLSLKLLSNFVDICITHSWEHSAIGVNKNLRWLPEQATPVLCCVCFLTFVPPDLCFKSLFPSFQLFHGACLQYLYSFFLKYIVLKVLWSDHCSPHPFHTCMGWGLKWPVNRAEGSWVLSCSSSNAAGVCVPGPGSFPGSESCTWELGWAVSCQSSAL